MKEILEKLLNDEVEEIGLSDWYKNSAWLVFKVENKYYVVVIDDQQNRDIMDDTLKEIKESEINDYLT